MLPAIFPEIADRKLCFGLFCHPFALLRTSSAPELKRRGRISSFFHLRVFQLERDSSGDLPPRNDKKEETLRISLGLRLRTALRGRAPQKVIDFLGTPRLAPQNDRMSSRHLFSISNFRN